MGLVTDSYFPTGTGFESGTSFLTHSKVRSLPARDGDPDVAKVTAKGTTLYRPDGGLAGTAMTLLDAVQNVVRWGVPVPDALRLATLSLSPAQDLGLPAKGQLVAGADADIVVLDDQWNPRAVFVRGRPVMNRLTSAQQ